MAFMDKYPFDVLSYVATEIDINVTNISTMSELKEAILNSERLEEEEIKIFMQATFEHQAEEKERKLIEYEEERERIEHEKIIYNLRLEMEIENQKCSKLEEELDLYIESYLRVPDLRHKRRAHHRESIYSSASDRCQMQESLYVGGERFYQRKRRCQKPCCWSCGSQTHFKKSCPSQRREAQE